MEIVYKTDIIPAAEQVIELYEDAGLKRPTHDKERISKMYENSNLVVTAWQYDQLVGVARCITDWAWSCYLADLAVRKELKGAGIGKRLLEVTKETLGKESMILLLSVPTAFEYYPKVGFSKEDRAFIMHRQK